MNIATNEKSGENKDNSLEESTSIGPNETKDDGITQVPIQNVEKGEEEIAEIHPLETVTEERVSRLRKRTERGEEYENSRKQAQQGTKESLRKTANLSNVTTENQDLEERKEIQDECKKCNKYTDNGIFCTKCQRWYHYTCIPESEDEVCILEDYICQEHQDIQSTLAKESKPSIAG